MRVVAVVGLALLASGCGDRAAGGPECTEIGTPVGIALDIAAPYASGVDSATVVACWAGSCRNATVELYPSSTAGPSGCAGEVCSAQAVPTGGKHGFADFPDLPATRVQVTLTLTPSTGGPATDRAVDVTPVFTHPNGAHCPAGGPQAGLLVTADGTLTQRR